ncbi:MAG: hypothetical protein MJZ18_10220 [Bacteroidales bacterium]|nr:hypothetical protein [Bacteroidales bacterium]
MKINFRYMMMLAAAGFALGTTSCDEGGVDDLQGIYAAPSELTVTGATVERTKAGNLRTFAMKLANTQGASVDLSLVSNTYFLTSNTYTIKSAAEAKNGNIIGGVSTVNGSPITGGSITLVQDGDDYAVSTSVLFTGDGKSYKLKGSFFSEFLPDDPTALVVLKGVTPNMDGTVTVVASTGGYTETFNPATYQMEYKGEGNDIQIVFNTKDGKLAPGTYAPGTGYVIGEKFLNNAYEAFGVPAFDDFKGSLWYTIADGARTPQLITTGNIVVEKNGPLYSILLDQGKGGIYAEYVGGVGSLDPDGNAGEVVVMNNIPAVTNWASFGWGINFIDIQMANGTVASTFDPATNATVYSGTGLLVQAEPFSADGNLARGEYEISAEMGPGKAQAGCDNAFAPGSPSGCYLCEVKDGVLGAATYIPYGTVKIEGEGDNTIVVLTVTDEVGVATKSYVYVGNIGL